MNQCSFETVNYTSTGECQSVNYYSFFPQCVNKEGADINIPSHCFMWWNKLTGTDCGLLGLMHQHTQTHTHTHTLFVCFILLFWKNIWCYKVINHKKIVRDSYKQPAYSVSCDLWPSLEYQSIKTPIPKEKRSGEKQFSSKFITQLVRVEQPAAGWAIYGLVEISLQTLIRS